MDKIIYIFYKNNFKRFPYLNKDKKSQSRYFWNLEKTFQILMKISSKLLLEWPNVNLLYRIKKK